MFDTRKFLVACYLLPVAAAVLPSEILLVAKLFTTGSSICLPGITSTFTEASNLIALLQLSKRQLQPRKRRRAQAAQELCRLAPVNIALSKIKQQQNKTVTL